MGISARIGFISMTLTAGMAMAVPWPQTVHPGMTVQTVNLGANYSTMGIDFLSNGDMVLVTCNSASNYGGGGSPSANANSAVYLVSNITGTPSMRKIADMFRQPSGVVVGPNDEIVVTDRDAIYRIPSLNPGNTGTNKTKIIDNPVVNAWHQWIFTPMYYNGRYYAPYSGTIVVGGPSGTNASSSSSGAFLSWAPGGGSFTRFNGGLRSPNGSGIGANGMMMVCDNQGSWLPASTCAIMRENRFYGHRQSPPSTPNFAENLPYDPPIWMVDGETNGGGNGPGQSTSQPLYMDRGPFQGDWIVGDVNAVGISRIALDHTGNGNYNGSLLFFTGGIGSSTNPSNAPAPNRLAWHPTQNIIYVGTIGLGGNWPNSTAQPFYRITLDNAAVANVFEIKSVHSRTGGVEIVFTQPFNPSTAVPASFSLESWTYNRTAQYGCCVQGRSNPSVSGVQVSNDNRRLLLQVNAPGGIDKLLRITAGGIRSASGGTLFLNQASFSHNYQNNVAFNPAGGTPIAKQSPGVKALASALTHSRPMPGLIRVKVNLEGTYSLALQAMNGALLEEKNASGPSELEFTRVRGGMHILVLRQGEHSFARPVVF